MRGLLLLALLPTAVFGLDILVYLTIVGPSHLSFMKALVDKLTERGHTVDLILARLNSGVTSNGTNKPRHIIPVAFDGISPYNSAGHLKEPFEHSPQWNPFAHWMPTFTDVTLELCKLVLASTAVREHLSSHRYDIALVSGYEFCPYGLMAAYGDPPIASFAATPAMSLQIHAAGIPNLPGYENLVLVSRQSHDRTRFVERLLDQLRVWGEHHRHANMAEQFNLLFRSHFGDDFPDMRELSARAGVDFANSHPLLDEARPSSHRLKHIGGVAMNAPKKLNQHLDAILSRSPAGTVLFSFGTQVPAELIPKHIVQNFVDAFKLFPEFTFLWKYDSSVHFENATNIVNEDWIPQNDLLNDRRVVGFISHMGLNSFTESAFAGVPIISIAIFGDQVHNSWRAEKLGTGVTVIKTEITVENMRVALEKILKDESYRDRARELAEKLKKFPETATRTFTEAIEFAAGYKNLHKHYLLAGSQLPLMAQYGYDVVLFLAIVSFSMVALFLLIVYRVMRHFYSKWVTMLSKAKKHD